MKPPASLAQEPPDMIDMFKQAIKFKLALLMNIINGSNVAVKLVDRNVLKFSLPKAVMTSSRSEELPSSEIKFLSVCINIEEDRIQDGVFQFDNKV